MITKIKPIIASFIVATIAVPSFALTQNEKGKMNFAGMCTAVADEGNKMLRAKGKTSNFNNILIAAENDVRYVRNKPGAVTAYNGMYDATLAGMKDYTIETKTSVIMMMLAECAKMYKVQ